MAHSTGASSVTPVREQTRDITLLVKVRNKLEGQWLIQLVLLL